jgi:clan AA aspartic protease
MPMFGTVAADGSEPLLPLALLGAAENGSGRRENIEAVIDTGFDGELTLQEATIRRLGYPYSGSAGGTLADGSEVQFDYYEGRVLWHGFECPVAVIGAEGQPLIGMGLLGGSRLTLDAEPDGEVLVENLAKERAEERT